MPDRRKVLIAGSRYTGQRGRIFDAMKGGEWRSLDELADLTGDPQASISAVLREFRKPKHGYTLLRKRVLDGKRSFSIYQLIVPSR